VLFLFFISVLARPSPRLFPFPQGKGLGVRLPRTRSDALFFCHPDQSEQSSLRGTSDSFAKSVILTEASERSLRGRTSDSFAHRSRHRFQVAASKKSVILTERAKLAEVEGPRTASRGEADTGSKSPHPTAVIAPYFLGSPFLHREGGQGVRFRTSNSKHRQSVILTVASERSLRGRTSDSFAQRSRYRFLESPYPKSHRRSSPTTEAKSGHWVQGSPLPKPVPVPSLLIQSFPLAAHFVLCRTPIVVSAKPCGHDFHHG
jgi:hypothetical protein